MKTRRFDEAIELTKKRSTFIDQDFYHAIRKALTIEKGAHRR
jgi:hypothetical protein